MKRINRVFIIGNGMSRFYKPGKHNYEYTDLAKIAVTRTINDAGIKNMIT